MAGEVQGFLQTAAPVVDQTIAAQLQVPLTIGNAPTLTTASPYGGAQNTAFGSWISTGSALATDYGGTSNPSSGVELELTSTAGTVNGLGPDLGIAGPFTTPPAGTLVLPFSINQQCLRFEVFGMYWDVVPAGTQCLRDSGVVFLQGGAGAGVIYDNPQTGNGGQNYGWGVVVDTATGKLMFVAKQVNGTGGAGLSAKVDLVTPTNGLNKPFYLDIRWYAPQLAAPASIQILLDGVDLTPNLSAAQSAWGAGTVLPSLNVSGSSKSGAFYPVIANNTPTGDTANPGLHFQGARLRIGSIAACTLENQH
jgi:hypothetical protein